MTLVLPSSLHSDIVLAPVLPVRTLNQSSHTGRPLAKLNASFSALIGTHLPRPQGISDFSVRSIEFIEQHIHVCQDGLSKMEENYVGHAGYTETKLNLQHELNTWKLLYEIRKSSDEFYAAAPVLDPHLEAQKEFFSPEYVFETTCLANTHYRKINGVLSWLQDMETLPHYLNNGSIHFPRTRSLPDEERTLTSLDPDTVTRNKINIGDLSLEEKQDCDEENDLLRTIWSLIRKGDMKQVLDVCRQYGEHWRATSLSGGTIFDDDMVMDDWDGIEGNRHLKLWLDTCRVISQHSPNEVERCVYGSLCGNIGVFFDDEEKEANLNTSFESSHIRLRSWEDCLWICLKSKQIRRMESVLCNGNMHSGTSDRMEVDEKERDSDEWEGRLRDLESIFGFVESYFGVSEEADPSMSGRISSRYRVISKYMILNDIPTLFRKLHNMVASPRDGHMSLSLTRLGIHLYLYFHPNVPSTEPPNEYCAFLIHRHLNLLTQTKLYDLVSHYCRLLSPDACIRTYSKFLLDIEDHRVRNDLLVRCRKEGVFDPSVIASVTQNLGSELIGCCVAEATDPSWVSRNATIPLVESDFEKMDTLEFLFTSSDVREAILRANQVFFNFAREHKDDGFLRVHDAIEQHGLYDELKNRMINDRALYQHFLTLECWIMYGTVMRWFNTWAVSYNQKTTLKRIKRVSASVRREIPLGSLGLDHLSRKRRNGKGRVDGDGDSQMNEASESSVRARRQVDDHEATNFQNLSRAIENLLCFCGGWMNPNQCVIDSLSAVDMNDMRGVILMRIIDQVQRICLDSDRFKYFLRVVSYVIGNGGYDNCLGKHDYQRIYDHIPGVQIKLMKRGTVVAEK